MSMWDLNNADVKKVSSSQSIFCAWIGNCGDYCDLYMLC